MENIRVFSIFSILILVIETEGIFVLFGEFTDNPYKVTMVDWGPCPHSSQSHPEMQRHIIVIMALESKNSSQRLPGHIKHNEKYIFKNLLINILNPPILIEMLHRLIKVIAKTLSRIQPLTFG